MKITDVRVYPVNAKGVSVVANASVTIDDAVVIYVKLINGRKGFFLSLPSHSYEDEKGETVYKDDVYFLSRDIYDEVLEAVINAFEQDKPKTKRRSK